MEYTVKQISKSEYPSFTASADLFAEKAFQKGCVFLAQTEDGRPVGMLAAKPGVAVLHVSYIYVKPFRRNQGIAKKLLQALQESTSTAIRICVREGHPCEQALQRLVQHFRMEEDDVIRSFICGMEEPWAKELHKKLWDERYERIFQRFFDRGYQLKSFEKSGKNIIHTLTELVGEEFEYNTNPGMYSNVNREYSYCLFQNGVPKAFSLIETKDGVAKMHLLSRARSSAPGSFLLPLVQSYTALQDAGYEKIVFIVYDNNTPMLSLLTDGFLKPYIAETKTQRYYIVNHFERSEK